jgi:predicted ATPase
MAIATPHTTKQTCWWVLSGTTSSGKTTVGNYLKQQGFPVIPDITRIYIDTLLASGYSVNQIRHKPKDFFYRIHNYRAWVEEQLLPYANETLVFDRALPETIAYARVDGFDESPLFEKLNHRYQKILLLHPLPFTADDMRNPDPVRRLKVFETMKQVYVELGYNIVEIPVLETAKRETFLQEKVQGVLPNNNDDIELAIKNIINKLIMQVKAVGI